MGKRFDSRRRCASIGRTPISFSRCSIRPYAVCSNLPAHNQPSRRDRQRFGGAAGFTLSPNCSHEQNHATPLLDSFLSFSRLVRCGDAGKLFRPGRPQLQSHARLCRQWSAARIRKPFGEIIANRKWRDNPHEAKGSDRQRHYVARDEFRKGEKTQRDRRYPATSCRLPSPSTNLSCPSTKPNTSSSPGSTMKARPRKRSIHWLGPSKQNIAPTSKNFPIDSPPRASRMQRAMGSR